MGQSQGDINNSSARPRQTRPTCCGCLNLLLENVKQGGLPWYTEESRGEQRRAEQRRRRRMMGGQERKVEWGEERNEGYHTTQRNTFCSMLHHIHLFPSRDSLQASADAPPSWKSPCPVREKEKAMKVEAEHFTFKLANAKQRNWSASITDKYLSITDKYLSITSTLILLPASKWQVTNANLKWLHGVLNGRDHPLQRTIQVNTNWNPRFQFCLSYWNAV